MDTPCCFVSPPFAPSPQHEHTRSDPHNFSAAEAARPTIPQRLADAILHALEHRDINLCLGIPGSANAPLLDAIHQRPNWRFVSTAHEQNAGYAALGYAAICQRLALVCTTSGPGITNLMTPIAAAREGSLPMLICGGDVAQHERGAGVLQDGSAAALNLCRVLQPWTVHAQTWDPSLPPDHQIDHAIDAATCQRPGPSFLHLPFDLATRTVAIEEGHAVEHASFQQHGRACGEESLAQLSRKLSEARRALIVVGHGCRWGKTRTLIRALAEHLGLRVATTPMAKGLFPHTHPLAVGVLGHGGHEHAAHALLQSDLVFIIGAGCSETSTNRGTLRPADSTYVVRVDIDPARIHGIWPVNLPIVARAEEVLQQLLVRIPTRRWLPGPCGVWRDIDVQPPGQWPSLRDAIRRLHSLVSSNTIHCVDVGSHTFRAMHDLELRDDEDLLFDGGIAAMGSSIGLGLGAKLAAPHRPVVVHCGDRGFLLNGNELATCVQEGLGVVFAVYNDARPAMVQQGQMGCFGRSVAVAGPCVDFAGYARSFGARGIPITCLGDFSALDRQIFSGRIPTVLDIRIDPFGHEKLNGRLGQVAQRMFMSDPQAPARGHDRGGMVV